MPFPLLIPLALGALGTFSAVNTYQTQKDNADNLAKQAQYDREAAQAQIERDAIAESNAVSSERDKKRRARDSMFAQYATSGVMLSDSVSDVMVDQIETDEVNVQRMHDAGNDQRNLDDWNKTNQYEQSMYSSKSMKKSASVNLFTSLASTALSTGMGVAAGMGGAASPASSAGTASSFNPPTPLTGMGGNSFMNGIPKNSPAWNPSFFTI
jgi:hypothetical protein